MIDDKRACEVMRSWPGGPLRRWSPVRQGQCKMPLAEGGFGGSYVCEGCSEPVAGVYRVFDRVERQESWLCAHCKEQSDAHKVPQKEKSHRVTGTHGPSWNGLSPF